MKSQGGTWFENTYPGLRCDIPAHVYQSTFEPNIYWTEEYAQGSEIREYWQRVARKYGVYERLRSKTKVGAATWDEQISQWRLDLEDLVTKKAYSENFDVVVNAIGRFNAWKLPEIPGIEVYSGHLRHASNWDPDFNPEGKSVAVIGNGASGIQVVANLSKVVSRLDHYARSPTWIAGSFAGEGQGRKLEASYYSPEVLDSFQDPDKYFDFRKNFEAKFYGRFETILRDSEANKKLREEFRTSMTERTKANPELIQHLMPDFSPNCRRLTPGPGYLEALTEPNVEYIRTPIAAFVKDGILTVDRKERKVDAVICCTGANTKMLPPFPIVVPGFGSLQEAWTPSPYTYLGTASPSFPNLLFLQGPNCTGFSGTVPNQVETQTTYIAQLLRKIVQQRIRTFVPTKAATDDFMAYSDAFFARTVFTEGCKSWANGGRPGARIHGHWPGSASHLNFIRRNPRWEDFEWTYRSPTQNRFAYFGNGSISREVSAQADSHLNFVPYLKRPDLIDLRLYHEEWFEV